MDLDLWDLLLGCLTILSAIWAFISERYRLLAIIIAFVLVTIIVLSKQNQKIFEMCLEQKKLIEKLKIHEQLTDIKAEIKEIQRNVFKK